MSFDHTAKRAVVLLIIGTSGGALAACSSQPAASAPTWRPGVGELTIKSGPPLTKFQASQLVKKGCSLLAEVQASVASVTSTDGRGSSDALVVLDHGPWYTSVSIGAAGTFPEFTHIAADAEALDLATIASLNGAGIAGVASSVTRLSEDCRTLGLPPQ